MYRQIISVNAKSKKEAVINLCRAFKEVFGCERNSEISVRVCVPDKDGDIDDSEFSDLFSVFSKQES